MRQWQLWRAEPQPELTNAVAVISSFRCKNEWEKEKQFKQCPAKFLDQKVRLHRLIVNVPIAVRGSTGTPNGAFHWHAARHLGPGVSRLGRITARLLAQIVHRADGRPVKKGGAHETTAASTLHLDALTTSCTISAIFNNLSSCPRRPINCTLNGRPVNLL